MHLFYIDNIYFSTECPFLAIYLMQLIFINHIDRTLIKQLNSTVSANELIDPSP